MKTAALTPSKTLVLIQEDASGALPFSFIHSTNYLLNPSRDLCTQRGAGDTVNKQEEAPHSWGFCPAGGALDAEG